MLTNLQQQPADALLALIKLHNADPRADKIDLGVGVYKTGQGDTPVFSAVKAAECRLAETQDSKAYLGPEGDMGFVEALMPYVDKSLSAGVPVKDITRHILGLYQGMPGARRWRQILSQEAYKPAANANVIREALKAVARD